MEAHPEGCCSTHVPTSVQNICVTSWDIHGQDRRSRESLGQHRLCMTSEIALVRSRPPASVEADDQRAYRDMDVQLPPPVHRSG